MDTRETEGTYVTTLTGKIAHVVYKENHDGKQIPVYGFIRPFDSEIDDVFMHHNEIEPWRQGFKEFEKGQLVKFDVYKLPPLPGKDRSRLQARNVEIKQDEAVPLSEFNTGIDNDNVGNFKKDALK